MPTWENLEIAFSYIQDHLDSKRPDTRFTLSVTELVFVSNFKGGMASIAEPRQSLEDKLGYYSSALRGLNELIDGSPLRSMQNRLPELQRTAQDFLGLTEKDAKTKIKGFGPANASALLAAYFPETLPVIDRLVLLGADIEHKRKQGQVIGIAGHYPALIAACQKALIESPHLTLRQLDQRWFEVGQLKNKEWDSFNPRDTTKTSSSRA